MQLGGNNYNRQYPFSGEKVLLALAGRLARAEY